MGAGGFSVFVNIGAKLMPSLNTAARGVEERFGKMNRSLRIQAAETKLAFREMSAAMSPLAAMAAAGGLGLALKGAIGNGASYMHEIAMMKNMGRTATEVAAAVAQAHKTAFEAPTSTWTENLKTLNETTMAFGGLAHALENLTFMQKLSATLSNTLGDDHGMNKDASYSLIKALEMRGMGTKAHPGFDNGRFRSEASQFGQASIASGGKVTAEELFNFMKKASPFVQGFSQRYMWRIAPTLMQEQGGEIAGTQNATWIGTILGKAKNKISTEAWMKLGLLDPKQVVYNKVGPVGWRPGAITNTNLAMSDPLKWTEDVLLPALRKNHVDTSDILSMQKALMPLFRDRNANRLAVMLGSLQTNTNLHKDERLINKVPGVGAAYKQSLANDPMMASKALHASLNNLETALGKAMFSTGVITGINKLAAGINWMAGAFDRHPNFALVVNGLMGIGLVTASAKVLGIGLRWAFAPIFGIARFAAGGLWRLLGPALVRGFLSAGTLIRTAVMAFGPIITESFAALAPVVGEAVLGAFALLSNPVGWAVLAGIAVVAVGTLAYHFRDQIGKWYGDVKAWFVSLDWGAIGSAVGMAIANGLTFGLAGGLASLTKDSAGWWRNHAPTWLGGSSGAAAPVAGAQAAHPVVKPVIPAAPGKAAVRPAAAPVTIHVHAANDPDATAAAVDRRLRQHAQRQDASLED